MAVEMGLCGSICIRFDVRMDMLRVKYFEVS